MACRAERAGRGRRGNSRFAALAARRGFPPAIGGVRGETDQAPSLHTESSLLSAMEHCGRELRDDELRDSLKGNGIGTPATRASIIETLFARDYVRREKKSLVPTDKGLAVYQIVKDKRIADVEMTGQWETALAKIESGGDESRHLPQGHRGLCRPDYRRTPASAGIGGGRRTYPVPQMPFRSHPPLPEGRQVQQRRLWAYRLPWQGGEAAHRQPDCRPCNQRQNIPYQRIQEQGG